MDWLVGLWPQVTETFVGQLALVIAALIILAVLFAAPAGSAATAVTVGLAYVGHRLWGLPGTAGGFVVGFLAGAVVHGAVSDWLEARHRRWLERMSKPPAAS